jgi:RNA polymerase sigma factor (sigma-70 family)
LAFEVVYPNFRDQLTEEEFLGLVYDTLGFPGSQPRGLFETFDPTRYSGSLPLNDHFINLFKLKLDWRLKDWLRQSDRESRPLRRDDGSRYDRIDQERVEALQEGMGLLTQGERKVVYMKYWGRCSQQEVAVELKLDRETIRRRHGMAIGKLREFFGIFGKSAA